jgi:hypothetical protein
VTNFATRRRLLDRIARVARRSPRPRPSRLLSTAADWRISVSSIPIHEAAQPVFAWVDGANEIGECAVVGLATIDASAEDIDQIISVMRPSKVAAISLSRPATRDPRLPESEAS